MYAGSQVGGSLQHPADALQCGLCGLQGCKHPRLVVLHQAARLGECSEYPLGIGQLPLLGLQLLQLSFMQPQRSYLLPLEPHILLVTAVPPDLFAQTRQLLLPFTQGTVRPAAGRCGWC